MSKGAELTPRTRVLLALEHRETDRVPVDILATPEVWVNLRSHLGIHDPEDVMRHLGVDLRHPRQPYVGPPLPKHPDGSWTDAWGVRRRPVAHGGGVYDEIIENPLAKVQDASELQDCSWPRPDWWDAEALAQEIRNLDKQESYAIALEEFGDPGGIFEIGCYLRGMEQFMVDMVENPDLVDQIMCRVTDFYVGMAERVLAASPDRIDLIWTSDDIAHQHGRLISGRTWRQLIAPHHERLNRRIHELGSRVMYHSCGAVRPFIPGLIEIARGRRRRRAFPPGPCRGRWSPASATVG